MKAAVTYQINTLMKVVEIDQDPPKYGEVRVKMGAAGICASDLHVLHGTAAFPLPAVLGHEGAGTVIEVGDGVTRVKPGDRCILSFVSNCGHCRTCGIGLPNICETNLETPGRLYDNTVRLHDGEMDIYQMSKLGVFGETIITPQQACVPMPDGVPMDVAALIGCCVTTGVGAVINSPVMRPGMSVAVFGCGGVGLNVVQGACLAGASRVIAIDIHDHKLEFSYKFGATDVINSREVDPVEAIKALTGDGVDMAFDSFGSGDVIVTMVNALRRGGTAVAIGLVPLGEPAPIDPVEMVRGQKSLVGSYYGSASPHQTFKKLVDYYIKGKLDIESLITRHYQLEEINEGVDAIGRGEDGRGVIMFPD